VTVRTAVAPPARLLARALTASWPEYSRLFAVGERGGWSVDEDARQLEACARRLAYPVGSAAWARLVRRQSVFLSSHFEALQPRWRESSHRLATAYLHGRPGTAGAPEFDEAFEALRRNPWRLARIQVTHSEMHELVLSAGIDASRVFRIPIGIDIEHFPLREAASRERARSELGLPQAAFVAGSFQKDGVGWGEGLEPKLVKGPDVLLSALELLGRAVPELHVLLTGPARGYVRKGLERLGIPYCHVRAESRSALAAAYRALDVYLVTSRQEGGPKAVLESLASGVPHVTTRVGQAQDHVVPGHHGWLADVGDAEGIAGLAAAIRDGVDEEMTHAGRVLAESLAYERLDERWSALLDGFVEREPR
jgi:glycosyltransferase involved in cell wall biosynthesis